MLLQSVTGSVTAMPALGNTVTISQTLHLHHSAHEILQPRVQRVDFARRQHAAHDNEAVALQRVPLQLREVIGRCVGHSGTA
jgi:hypothetical protein